MNDEPAPPARGPEPEQRPRRVQPRIIAAPKHGQIYWCDFWLDAQLPEMWKTRPVVVVSYRNRLDWPCLIVPISTWPQDDNPWALRFAMPTDGGPRWAICNQPSTVAPSRFTTFRGKVPRLSQTDFDLILGKVLDWLPKRPPAPS